MMWHEARKQEKKIRGMIVDYHRRAERRRDYYEKIKADPTQFLQIHGRPCKIHLDPAVAMAGDSPANMMPWQGRSDVLIDRFDVRAHLDFIPEPQCDDESTPVLEERQANYERYRILVQNEFLGVSEEKFLRQLYLEEQFGPVGGQQSKEPPPNPDKKGKKVPGAAIGYVYEDDNSSTPQAPVAPPLKTEKDEKKNEENEEEEDEDSDVDFDMCLDISKIGTPQAHEMNLCGLNYGMSGNDFFSFLTDDVEEQEALKLAREQEEEKAMFAGRKSRRERRAFREKKLVGRKISPPSYATRSSPTYDPYRMSPKTRSKSKSQSRSRSASPVNAGVIQYITSFGDEEEGGTIDHTTNKAIVTPVSNTKTFSKDPGRKGKLRSYSSSSDHSSSRWQRKRSRSRSRSLSRSRGRRRRRSSSRSSRSHSCSRSRSRSRKRSSSSRSSSRNRSRSRSNSRNRSWAVRKRHSSSSSRSRSPSRSRKRSQSERNSQSPSSSKKKCGPSFEQVVPPQQPVQRYYGRHRGSSSSSDLEASEDENGSSSASSAVPGQTGNTLNRSNRSGFGNSRPAAKMNSGGSSSTLKMTPQERLKKKMQALLNRQYKADKKAERARQEKAEQERMDREEELREMAIKMRRRERQKRHRMRDGDHDDGSDVEDKSQWSSGSSDSRSENSSPTRPSRRSLSRSPEQVKPSERSNRWDNTSRTHSDEKRHQREDSKRDDRSKREEHYRRRDSNSSYRKDEGHFRDDSSNFRREESAHRRESSNYRSYRRDEGGTFRKDDSYSGSSRFDTGVRRETYRTPRDESSYRSNARSDWNRREDGVSRGRFCPPRASALDNRREDERHSDSTKPKLVDY